jgi:predicted nucleic-acid-binding protein
MTRLLDTNVLIRFLTTDKNKKFKGVFQFFQNIEKGKIVTELKLIVLFQTIFVLKSYYKVPKIEIAEAIQDILKLKGLRIKEKRIVQRAVEIWKLNNIEIVDAYLIGCLEKDSNNALYSYDKDFDKFGINRIEP